MLRLLYSMARDLRCTFDQKTAEILRMNPLYLTVFMLISIIRVFDA